MGEELIINLGMGDGGENQAIRVIIAAGNPAINGQ